MNHDQAILYTAKAESANGIAAALDRLDPAAFEVVLYPDGSHDYTLRTENKAGALEAINDLEPESFTAVLRVLEAEEGSA